VRWPKRRSVQPEDGGRARLGSLALEIQVLDEGGRRIQRICGGEGNGTIGVLGGGQLHQRRQSVGRAKSAAPQRVRCSLHQALPVRAFPSRTSAGVRAMKGADRMRFGPPRGVTTRPLTRRRIRTSPHGPSRTQWSVL
jgi:hypothetical protein